MTDYAAANARWRRHRTALTKAENKALKTNTREAYKAVLALVAKQQAEWDAAGDPWPDDWSRWDRAQWDAQTRLRRLEAGW